VGDPQGTGGAMIRACLACGATDCLDYVAHEGPTGVIGPDACLETRTERGWRCSRCGAVEDETDWVPEVPIELEEREHDHH
jgi:hypothetical protein